MKKIGTLDYNETELRDMIIKDLENRISCKDLLNKYEDYAIYKAANDARFTLRNIDGGWGETCFYQLKNSKVRIFVEENYSITKTGGEHNPIEIDIDQSDYDRFIINRVPAEELEQWIENTSLVKIVEIRYFEWKSSDDEAEWGEFN